ncbi:MAG: pyridoxal phosphate-dependent aminotransferase [Paracoccaceae bacterium]
MRLSRRIDAIVPGAEDGWSVYYRAQEMRDAGHPIVMLTIGDHDVPTDPAICAAMKRGIDDGRLGYAPVEGIPELRTALAARESANRGPVSVDEIAVTAGGQAGLFAAMMAVLDPGDSAVVLSPYYATYEQTVRAAGGRPIVVGCPSENGFLPDISTIEAALAPDTRAILVNTPNNPTGAVYPEATIDALADLCLRRDLWMISDEVYASQVWEGRHISPRERPGMRERTFVVNSFSKSHAMTGSRLGWLIGPKDAIWAVGDLMIATTYGQPGFIQAAGAWALREGAAGEAEIRARYARRRAAALAALVDAGPLRVVAPAGGMYLMIDVRATGLSGADFAERLLDAEGIAVMPGESFGAAAAGHLRVALTVPEAALCDAIARIVAFARQDTVRSTAVAG